MLKVLTLSKDKQDIIPQTIIFYRLYRVFNDKYKLRKDRKLNVVRSAKAFMAHQNQRY